MKASMNEFFGFKYHPFTDVHVLNTPFMSTRDGSLSRHMTGLINHGKSMALVGPSGSGKSTLVHTLVQNLDSTQYKVSFLQYAGLKRSGIHRAVADLFGIETKGRIPVLVKLQKHIQEVAQQSKVQYPVLVIDDAQMLENEAFQDLFSLTVSPKRTAAASILLVGDETLAQRLKLHIMTSVRTRMANIFFQHPLNDEESRKFIAFRLVGAKAPEKIFEPAALELISSHCRGNRRQVMNMGTMLLSEAYEREEKIITAQLILECGLFDESE